MSKHDSVNHPKHYTSHPSGVECIQITEHYNFCIGNCIKYLWRNGLKNDSYSDPVEKQIEDCQKAAWYLNREIENLKRGVYNGKNVKEQNEVLAQGGGINQSGGRSQTSRTSEQVQCNLSGTPEQSGIFAVLEDWASQAPAKGTGVISDLGDGYELAVALALPQNNSNGRIDLKESVDVTYNHGTQWGNATPSGWDTIMNFGIEGETNEVK